MEKQIEELIEKYYCKVTEEPLHYLQWIEIVKDLKNLKRLIGENGKTATIHPTE